MAPTGGTQPVTPLPANGDDAEHLTDRLLNKMEKEQTAFDVQIGDGMDIGIMGENGGSGIDLLACSYSSFFSGDVKNLKLTVGLNHYQAATIMSSFPNNMASFPNHNISEFPFNDSIRYPSAWKQDSLILVFSNMSFFGCIHWCFFIHSLGILWCNSAGGVQPKGNRSQSRVQHFSRALRHVVYVTSSHPAPPCQKK